MRVISSGSGLEQLCYLLSAPCARAAVFYFSLQCSWPSCMPHFESTRRSQAGWKWMGKPGVHEGQRGSLTFCLTLGACSNLAFSHFGNSKRKKKTEIQCICRSSLSVPSPKMFLRPTFIDVVAVGRPFQPLGITLQPQINPDELIKHDYTSLEVRLCYLCALPSQLRQQCPSNPEFIPPLSSPLSPFFQAQS